MIPIFAYKWLAISGVILILGGTAYVQTKRLESYKAEHAAFVAQVEAEAAMAQLAEAEKERNRVLQINSAVASRDSALRRLRAAQEDSGRNRVSLTPSTAPADRRICFEPKAFAAAVERFRSGVAGIAGEGEASAIDASALIQAWPK